MRATNSEVMNTKASRQAHRRTNGDGDINQLMNPRMMMAMGPAQVAE